MSFKRKQIIPHHEIRRLSNINPVFSACVEGFRHGDETYTQALEKIVLQLNKKIDEIMGDILKESYSSGPYSSGPYSSEPIKLKEKT